LEIWARCVFVLKKKKKKKKKKNFNHIKKGLGKNEQGMTTPLITKKTTSNTAIIVNSTMDMASVLPHDIVMKKKLEGQNM